MSAETQYAILGCGYTGRRVASRLLARSARVLATTRHPERLDDLGRSGATVLRVVCEEPATVEHLGAQLQPGCRVLYSLPPVETPLWPLLEGRASRLVYLSTTGVYGARREVGRSTPPDPRTPRQRRRIEEERRATLGNWSWLILRPAAIYGPGRGVHVAMAEGTHRLIGGGDNFISRIHVDDLAAHAEAGLLGDLSGAWPVADEEPCRAREIAEFCSILLGVPMPSAAAPPSDGPSHEEDTRTANRRVSGQAIMEALGLELRYPGYRAGIPAALEEESKALK